MTYITRDDLSNIMLTYAEEVIDGIPQNVLSDLDYQNLKAIIRLEVQQLELINLFDSAETFSKTYIADMDGYIQGIVNGAVYAVIKYERNRRING